VIADRTACITGLFMFFLKSYYDLRDVHGSGRVQPWVGSGWVQDVRTSDEMGWVGSRNLDPCTVVNFLMSIRL